jgi:hypothetical protein
MPEFALHSAIASPKMKPKPSFEVLAVSRPICSRRISGNKAFIIYRIDADHAEWGTLKMSEVAIQEWSNGKVVREKFVY